MMDNFACYESQHLRGTGHLESTDCRLFVTGWHSRAVDDTFNTIDDTDLKSRPTNFLYISLRDQALLNEALRQQRNGLKSSIEQMASLINTLAPNLNSEKDPATCKLTKHDYFDVKADQTLCIAAFDAA